MEVVSNYSPNFQFIPYNLTPNYMQLPFQLNFLSDLIRGIAYQITEKFKFFLK